MIVVDTSGLLAAYDRRSAEHQEVMRVLRDTQEPLMLSPFVLAELDYLLATRLGTGAEKAALRDVSDGVYLLMPFEQAAVREAVELVEKYDRLDIGLADASIVVAAARNRTTKVLTLDQRHFRTVKPLWGAAFTVLPADCN